MQSFRDKTLIVTGATSGIGAAVANHFASLDANLLLTGRNAARAEDVAKACRAAGAGEVRVAVVDVTAKDGPAYIVAAALRISGRIDVLVNNAGILFRGTALECTDEQWDATITTNITSVFRMSRAALPLMIKQGHGAIVNIASDWALVGAKGAVAYGVSKGGVAQLTRSMALDHAREGIRVNAVCPGDTDTSMLDSAIAGRSRADGLKALGSVIPMGRVATVAEVAKVVAFLASDASSFMTGALVPVDGGNSAQ